MLIYKRILSIKYIITMSLSMDTNKPKNKGLSKEDGFSEGETEQILEVDGRRKLSEVWEQGIRKW